MIASKLAFVLCVLLALFCRASRAAPSSTNPAPAAPIRDFSILVYAAGDEKRLFESARNLLSQIEDASIKAKNTAVGIVIQHDDVLSDPGYRYVVSDGTNAAPRVLNEPPGQSVSFRLRTPPVPEPEIARYEPGFRYGEIDSGDPRTLKRFLNWAIATHPARHYILIVAGHSWGLQGHLQDFYYDGAYWRRSTLMKNYELRRALSEVLDEQKANIPEGVFDALIIDACVSGQLEVALELKDLAHYFASSSIETPYYGLPYDRVLLPFLQQANQRRGLDTPHALRLLEEKLLVPWTHVYVTDHIPGGQMAEKEQEFTAVATLALRNQSLSEVEESLRNLTTTLSNTSIPKELQEGRLSRLENLSDADGFSDLLHLSQRLTTLLSERQQRSPSPPIEQAESAARKLTQALHPVAQDPTFTATQLVHPTAQGAWIHIELDPMNPSAEMAACDALRLLGMLNRDLVDAFPTYINPKGEHLAAIDFSCETRPPSLPSGRPFGTPYPLWQLFNLQLIWPKEVPAYLTEYPPNPKTLLPRADKPRRILSLWIDKGSTPSLHREVLLSLPGSPAITIDYPAAAPLHQPEIPGFLTAWTGPSALPLASQSVRLPAYALRASLTPLPGEPASEPTGLYVAEAHSAGTLYKSGLGILLRRVFAYEYQKYFQGRPPIERIEPTPGKLKLDGYLESLRPRDGHSHFVYQGAAFYRLHRIAQTGWADLLFGNGPGPKPVVVPETEFQHMVSKNPYDVAE